MEKMTYVKAIKMALEVVENKEAKEKLEALKTSLAKKNGKAHKPTATQTANKGYKELILDGMEVGKVYTITELIKAINGIGELSNQRVSAIVRQLVLDGLVVRTEDKRKAYFGLPTETDADCQFLDREVAK